VLLAVAATRTLADADEPTPSTRPGIARLVAAYPGALCRGEANAVVFCDGTRMIYDDEKSKSFEEKLATPDLEDQLSIPYPRSWSPPVPPNADPGRIRVEAFFGKVYGASAAEVRSKLAPVRWLPGLGHGRVQVTTAQGIAGKLEEVSREVLRLGRATAGKVRRASGGFVWRTVAGTRRKSPHSWGIAIDVGVERASYWRWARPGPDGLLRFRNRIPLAVVEVFERHGFIWGGKWYHFDSMHFEYRPELSKP
jgi:hypothetical protein